MQGLPKVSDNQSPVMTQTPRLLLETQTQNLGQGKELRTAMGAGLGATE